MLFVFGSVIMSGASYVQRNWQTAQQDEIDLSVSSPVEIAEKELI